MGWGETAEHPLNPTVDEEMHHSQPWVRGSRGNGKGTGAVGPPNFVPLFSFHRGHRQGPCDLNSPSCSAANFVMF